jgi:hypothetical protein
MYVIEITDSGFIQMPVERIEGKFYFLSGKLYTPDPNAVYQKITDTPLPFEELMKIKEEYRK